ncbi:hypothetical protein D3C80_1778550 [compost metagenome]
MWYSTVTITGPTSVSMSSLSTGTGQCSDGVSSSASVSGSVTLQVSKVPSARPPAASSRLKVIVAWLASVPHSRPPQAMAPKKIRMYTDKARALTQAGTEVCAATCRLDSTAIHAAPLSSIAGSSA